MQSPACISSGLRPLATVRQVISRSVITPTGRLLDSFSMIGISPQSFSTISFATSSSDVAGVAQAGFEVIRSFTFPLFGFSLLLLKLRGPSPPRSPTPEHTHLLRVFHLVHFL